MTANIKYQEKLFSRHGLATRILAREFLKYKVGDRIPTVTEVQKKLDISRGTIQSSVKLLCDNKAIELLSKGHLGTYLISRDMKVLFEFAGINSLVGAMPLPYSRRYEGLATGLIRALENEFDIPVSLAYMRGAKNRISMILADRYDFAVMSRYAAQQMIDMGQEIVIVKNFGSSSFLSSHVLILRDRNGRGITNGMRVGIDMDSIDQKNLTENACLGKKVELVEIDYSQILEHITNGTIDAGIWNVDEIKDKGTDIHFVEFNYDPGFTEACIVCKRDHEEIISLLEEIVDVQAVKEIQELVYDRKLMPSY